MPTNIQSLIAQLNSHNPAQQATAAEALARMGREAQPAALALVTALRTADAPTREWCAAELEDIGPPQAAQIPELMKLADDQSLDAAYWAITLLGRAGKAAASAVSTLINIVQTSQESVLRERAAWALGKLGPTAASAVPALRAAADSNEPRLMRLAKQALDAIES
jgi:HEAT repeat protein